MSSRSRRWAGPLALWLAALNAGDLVWIGLPRRVTQAVRWPGLDLADDLFAATCQWNYSHPSYRCLDIYLADLYRVVAILYEMVVKASGLASSLGRVTYGRKQNLQ